MTARKTTRTERDTMGEMQVPAEAYWGASTQRAVLNFPASGLRYPAAFVHILGRVKRAAARANAGLEVEEPCCVSRVFEDVGGRVVDRNGAPNEGIVGGRSRSEVGLRVGFHQASSMPGRALVEARS